MISLSSSRHVLPALRLLAACLGLAVASAHAETAPATTPAADKTQEHLQLASRQYAELQQMLALDERCHWLEPAARTALDATAQERMAWFNSHGGQAGHPEAAAKAAIAAKAALDCNSPEAKGLAHAIRYGSWQMRTTWALRGDALLSGADRPAWLKGKSSVHTHRAALVEAIQGLEAKYGVSIQNAKPKVRQEAEALLAVRCTGADNGCPKAEQSAAKRAYAEAWLKQAERYAAVLSKTKDKVGAPPPVE
ncbi:hypothetical protein [Pseudoxanthomonas koreensis]|uniref:hypothetical protein n=1 Tax=Pseudoxanthomonas koreensis TaxID=266061 RepID=UPI0035A625E3